MVCGSTENGDLKSNAEDALEDYLSMRMEACVTAMAREEEKRRRREEAERRRKTRRSSTTTTTTTTSTTTTQTTTSSTATVRSRNEEADAQLRGCMVALKSETDQRRLLEEKLTKRKTTASTTSRTTSTSTAVRTSSRNEEAEEQLRGCMVALKGEAEQRRLLEAEQRRLLEEKLTKRRTAASTTSRTTPTTTASVSTTTSATENVLLRDCLEELGRQRERGSSTTTATAPPKLTTTSSTTTPEADEDSQREPPPKREDDSEFMPSALARKTTTKTPPSAAFSPLAGMALAAVTAILTVVLAGVCCLAGCYVWCRRRKLSDQQRRLDAEPRNENVVEANEAVGEEVILALEDRGELQEDNVELGTVRVGGETLELEDQ